MKKYLLISIPLWVCPLLTAAQINKPAQQNKPVAAQTKPETPPANPLAEHMYKKYQLSSRWNDLDVAKDALYDLIIEFPGNDSLIFELAYFYFENQKYTSSAIICQDLIARNSRNTAALEVAAESYQAINVLDKALQHFESLYLVTTNPTVLYKVSFIQFQLKRLQECMTNVDILLSKPDSDKLKVVFNDAENKPKEYAMKVALLNLKGMVYREQADKVNARKFFDQALAIAPDFQPAKQNVAALK